MAAFRVRMRALIAVSFFVSAVTLAPSARAGSEADRLFQLGRRASEMGKFATACSLFRESHRLEPAVGTLLNLGDCEEQQNHLSAALDYYKDALSRLSVTDDRLEPLRVRMEAIEQRSAYVTLKLGEGAPRDSTVVVDGEAMTAERLKKPIMLPAGGHLVQVTAVGYRGSRQQVDLAAGERKLVAIWPGPQLEANELALAFDDRPTMEHRSEARSQALRLTGWIALGVGVAGLWVGSVTGLFAIDRESTRKDNCDENNACNRAGYDAARSGKTLATVSTVALSAGAAFVGGGIALVLANPSRDRVDAKPISLAAPRLVAVPLRSGGAVSFEQRF